MLDSRPKGREFEPHRRHCVVSLSKNINPSLVLVQPRKTRPYITERLLKGRNESNQIKIKTSIFQHVLLPLSEKDSMVLHPVSARKPKMLDNNDLGSCSATRLAEKHFITPAVPESIQT